MKDTLTDAEWDALNRGDRINLARRAPRDYCGAVFDGGVWSCSRPPDGHRRHVSASYGFVHVTWTDDR